MIPLTTLNVPTLKNIHKFFLHVQKKKNKNHWEPFSPIKINVHLITLCAYTNTLPIMQMYSWGSKKDKKKHVFIPQSVPLYNFRV